ncbi:uncharacterized protein LOC110977288 isoform X2 [Acanthaster planci]|uniref:Uncharacterized protein LOC110977288 isoform X2 n=1 Tax=Acanthaster planci TaxID=133434 RepID=A0A8B7Y1C7_ACAPL|nr:uncharacterized protein LOC110977288 isoform X2 [Acanthaster planci]
MARRDAAQFDDAFEDAESDLVNPKSTLDPHLHMDTITSSIRSNGELPESEKSESQCGEEIGPEEMNGALEGEDDQMEGYYENEEDSCLPRDDFHQQLDENNYYVEPADQFHTGEDMTESDNDREYQGEVGTEEGDIIGGEGHYAEDQPQDDQQLPLDRGEESPREGEEAEEDNIGAEGEGDLGRDTRVEGMQYLSEDEEEVEGEDFFEEVEDFYLGGEPQLKQRFALEEELPQSEQAESDSYEKAPLDSFSNPATQYGQSGATDAYKSRHEPDELYEVDDQLGTTEQGGGALYDIESYGVEPATTRDITDQSQSDSAEADQEEFSPALNDRCYPIEPPVDESLNQEQQVDDMLDVNKDSTKENKFVNVVHPNVSRFPEWRAEPPTNAPKVDSDSTRKPARQLASNQEGIPPNTVRPKSPKRSKPPAPRLPANSSTTTQPQRFANAPSQQASTAQHRDAQGTRPLAKHSAGQIPRSPTRRVPTRQLPSAQTSATALSGKTSPTGAAPERKQQERYEAGKNDARGVGPGHAQRRQVPESNAGLPKVEVSQQVMHQDKLMEKPAEAQKPLPVPGGARPVASLKSRFQNEMKEIFDLEKNLSSSTFINTAEEAGRRTQNGHSAKSASLPGQRTSPVRARHNDEYAAVSSLRSAAEKASPGLSTRGRAQAASQLPGQLGSQPAGAKTQVQKRSGLPSPAKRITSSPRLQAAQPEPPRNNSNANNLPRVSPGSSALQRGRVADKYNFNVSELSDGASGEVVFDDCDECGAYLDERMGGSSKSPDVPNSIFGKPGSTSAPQERPRSLRRRNSYEMANRESSSEDEANEGEYRVDEGYAAGSAEDSNTPSHQHPSGKEDLAGSSGGGKYDLDIDGSTDSDDRAPVIPPTGVDENLLARLAARELANLWKSNDRNKQSAGSDSGVQPDSSRQSSEYSGPSPPTTPQELGAAGAKQDQRKPNMPNVSPMEYDVVGVRLAGHAESNVAAGSLPPHPEEDQFSDADEEDEPKSGGGVGSSVVAPDKFPEKFNFSPGYKNLNLGSPVAGRYPPKPVKETPPPPKPVDVKDAMKELQQALSSSKNASMKTPSFYIQEQLPQPIWVMQPETAQKAAEEDRRRRIMEERKKRQEELRILRLKQREEYMQSTDPQCYQHTVTDEDEETDEGLESRQLISNQDKAGGNYLNKQRLVLEPDMRAPDLPPAPGRIQESLTKGIIYPAAYLGSTQLVTTKQPTKKVRMQQAQEAVNRIKTRIRRRWNKAPEGEEQPSTEVDLSISNEKIKVLNADTQETMMDHPLKTISYIADIGNIVVIMARRRVTRTLDEAMEDSGMMVDSEGRRQPRKIICHVFETEDAQLIAQTIGQAFAMAYLEFLKANGIEDHHVNELDYHDVLNSQEIYGDDLMLFSNKECEKEVLIEKERGEIMGVVIVESGWGSLIPTVVIANMSQFGAAARSGKLNIGDQVMSINGTSLVGLPLAQCQQMIKSLKSQSLAKFNIVSCPPVTQVLIKRPDTKYQLGFSVQNGIICSLMRGGIAERGGVRVGHRIIEINGASVVATAHEKIVEMLSTSVGEIRMKTMPLSMYKLLTGQEQPVYI